jgi:hypothetical protein
MLNDNLPINGHVVLRPFVEKNGVYTFAQEIQKNNMIVSFGRELILNFLKGESGTTGQYIRYIAFGSGGNTPVNIADNQLSNKTTDYLEVTPYDYTDTSKITFRHLLSARDFATNTTISEAGLFIQQSPLINPPMFSRVVFTPIALSVTADVYSGFDIFWSIQFS